MNLVFFLDSYYIKFIPLEILQQDYVNIQCDDDSTPTLT